MYKLGSQQGDGGESQNKGKRRVGGERVRGNMEGKRPIRIHSASQVSHSNQLPLIIHMSHVEREPRLGAAQGLGSGTVISPRHDNICIRFGILIECLDSESARSSK